jgi:hypothetical protein
MSTEPSDSKINEWLVSHKLDAESLKREYSETHTK